MKYAEEHAGAVADVSSAGSPVEFVGSGTRPPPDPLSPLGSEPTPGGVVPGWAVEVSASEAEMAYDTGETTSKQRKTLLFAPRDYGAAPEPGSTVRWAGDMYTVAQRWPTGPDGVAIIARVLVTR